MPSFGVRSRSSSPIMTRSRPTRVLGPKHEGPPCRSREAPPHRAKARVFFTRPPANSVGESFGAAPKSGGTLKGGGDGVNREEVRTCYHRPMERENGPVSDPASLGRNGAALFAISCAERLRPLLFHVP